MDGRNGRTQPKNYIPPTSSGENNFHLRTLVWGPVEQCVVIRTDMVHTPLFLDGISVKKSSLTVKTHEMPQDVCLF